MMHKPVAPTAVFTLLLLAVTVQDAPAQEDEFRTNVLPLLSARCFECHDGSKNTSGLRLDVRSLAMKGGETDGAGIVPGDFGRSAVWQRINSKDDDLRMPPEGEPLTTAEREIIGRWITQGAAWPDDLANESSRPENHWAFVAPQRPAVPAVTGSEWVHSPVDNFILEKLEANGLQPSHRADNATLLRRMHLDLIGLPPSISDLDRMEAAGESFDWAAEMERLLRSPHYGERWGRLWLDAARYADSDGYEKDKPRFVWMYRDWVVDAFNRNLPYDQFIIEQLAGDLLPDAKQTQHVATGFLRNSMINEEGGIDPEQFRMEAMFDRVDALGKGILGLTIQCAQCHDHKYDPISQKEYYELFACLNNDHEANIAVYPDDELAARQRILSGVEDCLRSARRMVNDAQLDQAQWEAAERQKLVTWQILQPDVEPASSGGQKYVPQPDGSFLAQGYAPTRHRVIMSIDVPQPEISAFRLELLNDQNLPRGGPGRSILGTAALTEFEVHAAPRAQPEQSRRLTFHEPVASLDIPRTPLREFYDDRSKKERVIGPVTYANDDDPLTAWGTETDPGRRNQSQIAVFPLAEPISSDEGWKLTIYLSQNHGGWNSDDNQNHNLGRFRLSLTDADHATDDVLRPDVRTALLTDPEDRTARQQNELFETWIRTLPLTKSVVAEIDRLWSTHPEGTSQLALAARTSPRETFVLKRGDFLQPLDAVAPGTPAILHASKEDEALTRLDLARWIVARDSPTAARAIVNRIWQAYFGNGLVESPEDLGTRCKPPTHPELLDFLAVELMDSGWDLQHVHRLIVSSSTWQQSAVIRPGEAKRDPLNHLLARSPRYRLDAELVRDAMLHASGLLNPAMGGPGVHPPLPDFLLQPPVSYGPKVWIEDRDVNRYRRAIYTFRFRSVPYPFLETFDAPNGDFSCVRREQSNTPLQPLMMLNETLSVECARALAIRTLHETADFAGDQDDVRLARAFRLCTSRRPDEQELAVLRDVLKNHRDHFAANTDLAAELVAIDDDLPQPKRPVDFADAELAAWISVARIFLNLDETVSRP